MKSVLKTRNLVVLFVSLLISSCGWKVMPIDEIYKDVYSTIQDDKQNKCLAHSSSARDCLDNDAPSYKEYKKMRQ